MKIYEFLDNLEIKYIVHEHPAVYTVEEAALHRDGIEGMHCKNLFLKDGKRDQYYLLSAPADKEFRLNEVRKMIKAKKLSFANADELMDFLKLEPGSVSPFGLINDHDNKVIYLVDQQLFEVDLVNFHPNINTATLTITSKDYEKFIKHVGNKYKFLEIQ